MCELLSTRETVGSDDQLKKLNPTGDALTQATATPQRKIVLLGLDSPHSSGHWDETPEDLALTSLRLASVLDKLTLQGHFLSLELPAAQFFPLCHRLLTAARRFQELCLPSPSSGPTADGGLEVENLRHDALVELLADSALSYALSMVSQFKPLIQDTSSSKVRLLSRVQIQRDLLVSPERFADFAQTSLRIFVTEPVAEGAAGGAQGAGTRRDSKIFRMFVRCFVSISTLSSQETLSRVLGQVTCAGGPTAGGTEGHPMTLLALLRALSSGSLVDRSSLSDTNRYRQASHLIVEWIESRSSPPPPPSSSSFVTSPSPAEKPKSDYSLSGITCQGRRETPLRQPSGPGAARAPTVGLSDSLRGFCWGEGGLCGGAGRGSNS
jgi:hypothetical protein